MYHQIEFGQYTYTEVIAYKARHGLAIGMAEKLRAFLRDWH
jgi:hypothetical protein